MPRAPAVQRRAPGVLSVEAVLPWVLLALAVGFFVWHARDVRFVQDDSYITYRYARNLVRGHGPVFNPGERVEGYTNFLWTVLVAGLGVAGIPWATIVPLTQFLGLLCGIGVLAFLFFILRRHSTGPPWLRGLPVLLLAANGAFAYWCVSGMETGLFSLLLTAAFFVYLGERTNRRLLAASALLGLAALTRPEGALFFALTVLHFLIVRLWPLVSRHSPPVTPPSSPVTRPSSLVTRPSSLVTRPSSLVTRPSSLLRCLAALVVPFMLLVAPLYLWRLSYYGFLFPNTFYAKTGLSSSYLKSGLEYFWNFHRAYGLWGLLLLAPPVMLVVRRRLRADSPAFFALLVLIVHAAYVVSVGGDVLRIFRFFVPVLPLLYLLAAEALWSLRLPKAVPALVLVVLLPYTLLGPFARERTMRRDIKRNQLLETGLVAKMSAAGRWLSEHMSENDWFACTTIGAVGFFSDRNMIDMLGLTDSAVAHHPEDVLGPRVYWKERNYNTRHVLERNPAFIYFSTGAKPSAAAERALFLRTRFRRGYYPTIVTLRDPQGVFSDNIFVRRPGAETLPIETPDVNPQFVDLYNLGINLTRSPSTLDSSVAVMRRCLELAPPDFAFPWEYIGEVYARQNQESAAVAAFEQAVAIDDNCIISHEVLGSFAYGRADYPAATGHFAKVVQYAPDYVTGYLYLAAGLLAASDYAGAEQTLLKAKTRFPWFSGIDQRLSQVRTAARSAVPAPPGPARTGN